MKTWFFRIMNAIILCHSYFAAIRMIVMFSFSFFNVSYKNFIAFFIFNNTLYLHKFYLNIYIFCLSKITFRKIWIEKKSFRDSLSIEHWQYVVTSPVLMDNTYLARTWQEK